MKLRLSRGNDLGCQTTDIHPLRTFAESAKSAASTKRSPIDAEMTGQDQRVRIVAIPQGEAPVWVRERWVGLELPIYPDQRGPETTLGHGVLSGPPPMTLDDFEAGRRGRLVVMSGYFVKAMDAIEEWTAMLQMQRRGGAPMRRRRNRLGWSSKMSAVSGYRDVGDPP